MVKTIMFTTHDWECFIHSTYIFMVILGMVYGIVLPIHCKIGCEPPSLRIDIGFLVS